MKKELINYLENTGKDKSWNDIAFMFGYSTGEQARKVWNNYCKKQAKLSNILKITLQPMY